MALGGRHYPPSDKSDTERKENTMETTRQEILEAISATDDADFAEYLWSLLETATFAEDE